MFEGHIAYQIRTIADMIIDVVVPIATKKRAEIFKLNDFSFLLIFKSIVGRPPLLWVY